MIRYFCDRCTHEVDANGLKEVTLPKVENNNQFRYEVTKNICTTCILSLRKLFDEKPVEKEKA